MPLVTPSDPYPVLTQTAEVAFGELVAVEVGLAAMVTGGFFIIDAGHTCEKLKQSLANHTLWLVEY